jgi:predicted RNA-binding Zn ribbon-like protein
MTSQPCLPVIWRYTVEVALPSWVPEIETKPAPMPLLLVQSFVNTYEADTDVDLLEDLDVGVRWLREAGLAGGGSVTSGELERSREVRESLRALLVQNAGGDVPSLAQLEPLIALGAASSLQPNVGVDGRINLEAHEGATSIRLGSLLLIVRDAQRDGSWDRLKACRNDECLWAFYDRSHAGRGAWCDMASCGNKIKNRNLRARRASLA